MNEPHVARRLPTKQFTGPPTEGIVARGRSVDVVLHDAEPEIVNYSTEEKRYIMRAQTRRAGPGETVCLPSEEINWLKSRGFIVNDDSEPVERSSTGSGIRRWRETPERQGFPFFEMTETIVALAIRDGAGRIWAAPGGVHITEL